jgi:hypothetical protein
MSNVVPLHPIERKIKPVSTELRLDALGLAQVNEDRAAVCTPDQQALATLFRMNAKLLRELVS